MLLSQVHPILMNQQTSPPQILGSVGFALLLSNTSFCPPRAGFAGPSFPVVYAAAGSDAHLSCELNDNPMDCDSSKIATRWSHMTGEDLKTKSNVHQENNRTLRLPAVGPGSAGQYLCEVTINSTTISKSITLVVMTGEKEI